MIPYLKPKIWYAFQGLPFERIDGEDRLPWSKCSVLTNNLMYILQYDQLTMTFSKMISKAKADERKGVTFNEYLNFFNTYLKTLKHISDSDDYGNRCFFQYNVEPETSCDSQTRIRGNTVDGSNVGKTFLKPESHSLVRTFDDYVWTLYRTKRLPHLSSQSILNEGFYNMWLLFMTYSIRETNTEKIKIPVVMDLLEAKYWCNRIQELLGSRRLIQEIDIREAVKEIGFIEFHNMMQDIFKCTNLNETVIEMSLSELTEEALNGVTMKGPIKIDRNVKYCVLKSFVLMIYNSKTNATNFRSSITLSKDTELLAGTNKIQLKSYGIPGNSLTLEIQDIQQFNKWRTALTDAIFYSRNHIHNPSIYEAELREKAREEKRKELRSKRLSMETKLEEERNVRSRVTEEMEQQLHKADEKMRLFCQRIKEEQIEKEVILKESEIIRKETDEKIKNVLNEQQSLYLAQLEKLQIIESEKQFLNQQLQATIEEKSLEEQKRTDLEEKHNEAQKMLSEAEEKISSLKELGEKLKKALEEEKQAKEEEEMVRNATESLLEEELKAKAKLEQLLEQQKCTIDSEIMKNNQIMEDLENERNRIKFIAEEKEKLTKKLENSQQKTQSTGTRVKNLDSKVNKIAETVFGKEDNRVLVSHRGHGFIAGLRVEARMNNYRNCPELLQSFDLLQNNFQEEDENKTE